jgi:hypothetical protein
VTADAPTAQTILAAFIDWVRTQGGTLTDQARGMLARQIGALLAQKAPDKIIRQALADWFMSGLHASTFDSFANTLMNTDARARAAQNGHTRTPVRPSTTDQAMAQAQALKAQLRGQT